MSLVRLLESPKAESFVKECLRLNINLDNEVLKSFTRFEDLEQYGLAHSAFKYLLKFRLYADNFDLISNTSFPLYVENALFSIKKKHAKVLPIAENIIKKTKNTFNSYLDAEDYTVWRELAKLCTQLAKLEAVQRSGKLPADFDPDMIVVQDITALEASVPLSYFVPQKMLHLSPMSTLSATVKGAEADILMDNVLLDVKTSKEVYDPKHIPALVANVFLHQLGKAADTTNNSGFIDCTDTEIKVIGLYYARHHKLRLYPLDKLFRSSEQADLLLRLFLEVI